MGVWASEEAIFSSTSERRRLRRQLDRVRELLAKRLVLGDESEDQDLHRVAGVGPFTLTHAVAQSLEPAFQGPSAPDESVFQLRLERLRERDDLHAADLDGHCLLPSCLRPFASRYGPIASFVILAISRRCLIEQAS